MSAAAFSPDGQTVLTGSEDQTARLWDVATGEPAGHRYAMMVMCGLRPSVPDGQTMLTGGADKTARLWDISPVVPEEPERIRVWGEVQTGQHWDDQGMLRALSFDDWLARRKRLDQLGGPPIPWRGR